MRVLLVTHDEARRRGLTRFLRDRGYDVTVPSQAKEVVPLVKEGSPDVMVLDLYVKNPSGEDVLREVRAQGYTGKVVVLTGQSNRATLSKCWRAGIDQVVGCVEATGSICDVGQVEVAIRTSAHEVIAQRKLPAG